MVAPAGTTLGDLVPAEFKSRYYSSSSAACVSFYLSVHRTHPYFSLLSYPISISLSFSLFSRQELGGVECVGAAIGRPAGRAGADTADRAASPARGGGARPPQPGARGLPARCGAHGLPGARGAATPSWWKRRPAGLWKSCACDCFWIVIAKTCFLIVQDLFLDCDCKTCFLSRF